MPVLCLALSLLLWRGASAGPDYSFCSSISESLESWLWDRGKDLNGPWRLAARVPGQVLSALGLSLLILFLPLGPHWLVMRIKKEDGCGKQNIPF